MPGHKYKAVFGPAVDRFAPNINFVDEAFSGTMRDNVEANLKGIAGSFKECKKLDQSPFKTEAGQTGIKLTTEAESNRKMIRQIYYFFEGSRGRKWVVTCSSSAKGGEAFDPVFDATVKTLQTGK